MQQNNDADREKQLQACRTELAELAKALQTERLRRQQVEEALREAERRFRAVFEQTFQFTGLLTPEGVLLEANQTALEFGGFQLADVVGRPFWEARWWTLSPETQEQLREAISQAAAGEFVRDEVDVLGADNSIITIDFSLKPVKDETGQVVLLVPEGRDITELKQAAQQELHQQTTKILESITDAFFAVDRDWRFTYVNSEAERLMQRTRDELLGQNMWDVYPGVVNTTFDREYHRAMVEQITVRVEEFCLPLNAWFDVKIYPAENGLSVYFRDITDCKQAGEALYQREQEFRALAENAPDIIARIDRQLRHLYVNAAIEPVTGLSPQNFIGKTHRELGIPEAQCVSWEEHLQHVFTTGQEQIIEFDFVTPNGTTRYYQSRLVPEFGQDGSIQSLLGISRDVTDFKQTASALRESQQLLQAILDTAPVEIYLKDLQGRYILVNRCCEDALSLSREQIIGKIDYEIWPREIADTFRASDRATLEAGTPLNWEQVLIPEADGLHTFITTKFPLCDAAGTPYAVCGISTDITERKRAEEALYQREQEFRALAENAPDVIARLDKQLRHVYVNAVIEPITGLTPQDYNGKTNRELGMPQELCDYWDENFQQVLTTGQERTLEFSFPAADGTTRYFQNRVVPEFALDGSVESILAVTRDVTAFKQTEAALQENQQLLQAILDAAPVAIYLKDLQGRYLLVNPCTQQAMGLTQEQIVGKSDYELIGQDLVDDWRSHEQAVLDAGMPVEIEDSFPQADGLHTYITTKFPLYDATGAAYAICGISTDITQRKQAEEALYRREQEFRALAENAPDIIARLDKQLRHLYVNAAAEPVTGLSPEDFIGKTWRELEMPEALCTFWEENFQRVFTTAKEHIIEYDLPTPDGTTKYYQTRIVPELALDGSVESVLVVTRDVTDFKLTEAALRESEERFRQLAENIDAVFWMRSLDEQLNKQEFLYLSPAYETIWGRTRESLYEQPDSWLDAIHPEDLPRLMALIEQQRQGEFPKREYRIVLPDGSIRWIQDRTFPIHNAEGRVYRVAGIAEDITERKQAEAALSESEERFRQLAENIDTLFWVFSLDEQQTLYISPAYEKIWGRSSQPLYENPQYWMETIHPEDRTQAALRYERLNNGELVEDVYRIVKPDGSVRWIRDRAFPVYDSQGRLYRAAGIAEDITERKQAEIALRESEERFRQLAENIDAIFWIFSLDERKFLYISPAYDKIWGRPRERLYEEATRWREGVHPEDLPAIAASAQRQLQGEFPERVYRIIRPDGSIRWLQDHTFPIYNSEGRLYRHAGIAEDITERKQAEAALQESEQKYRNLVETAQGLIWSVDSEGRFTFINQASKQFYGYEPEEMIGRKATEFTTPEQAQKDMEARRRVLAGESLLQYETMALRKDGTPFYISANAIVLRDEAGNVLGTTGTSIDITERKRAEEQLQASLQEKEALLKEVHHRVKNNLQVISSLLDLQSLQIQDASALEAFRESQNRVKSIALIHEQLYQSKNLARVNLADYIGSLTSNLLQTYSMNPNNITLQLKVDEIFLGIDKLIPCGLIINELVTNALKHGFSGNTTGTIWVEFNSVGVESPEEKVHQYTLVVGNNGIKLQDPQDLYSAKSLGLQLVNVLVQQLGGQLEITQNRGTEFKITFSDLDDLAQI